MTAMEARYFDTHCHLQDTRFGEDLAGVLERGRHAGISSFACCGTREADWNAVLTLAQQHEGVIALLGLHPWYIDEAGPGWLENLEQQLLSSRTGLGECGLDFALENLDREAQERVFRAQLALAKRLDRPVSIHCRRAWESLAVIAKEIGLPNAGAVIHSFSGSAEIAKELQRLGFHLSFSCSLANPENRRGAKAVVAVAEDRLLFETDAPDIPAKGVPGFDGATINEPANIHLVCEHAARLRNVEAAALRDQVYRNALRVFGGILP
jgi:TatD DNase family protein